ncbi:MAG TPA: nucleotidyltransferase domain-containing protein [archaeon]|nr:nucleotidyltransferase domain-containing protein [archaeon]
MREAIVMQPTIEKFASELHREIRKSRFRSQVVSIVLLGSAAHGEFIKGESDIDFMVVVRRNSQKKAVTKFVSQVLNRLDKKLDMHLKETCSDRNDYHNEILNIIMRLESSVFFGVPFYTISLEDYDFFRNRIQNPKIWFVATFLGSLNQFLLNVKDTGKTIYGRDLLKLINIHLTYVDKIKIFGEQLLVMFAGALVLPFSSRLALKHFVKSSLYQEEFDLMFLHKHLKGYVKDRKTFSKAFSSDKKALAHLKKSINYRLNYKKVSPSRGETLKYMAETLFFVFNTMRKTGI